MNKEDRALAIPKKVILQVGKKTTAPTQILNAVETLINAYQCYMDYLKTAEQEITKREAIQAWKEVELARINATREILITHLESSFDERKNNFQELFKKLDTAIEKEDAQLIGNTLSVIVEIAKSNPFCQLAENNFIREALGDPNKKIDI